MTEYTRENPFEFEGVKAHRDEQGFLWANGVLYNQGHVNIRALMAMIEAEREGWHWTNDVHNEARNGRWYVEDRANDVWGIWHDDFGVGALTYSDSPKQSGAVNVAPRQMLNDFLTWKAEQDQPEEPTGLGAVVEVPSGRFVNIGGDKWRDSSGCLGDHLWGWLVNHGPVTVLSEGVQ